MIPHALCNPPKASLGVPEVRFWESTTDNAYPEVGLSQADLWGPICHYAHSFVRVADNTPEASAGTSNDNAFPDNLNAATQLPDSA